MRLLYCALGDDYGDPSRGPSFEDVNFHDTLRRMPLELVHFDIAREILGHGYWGANRRLSEVVRAWQPDVLFSVMFEEQLDWEVVRDISRRSNTTTVGWFCDDHYRFEGYSRHWAKALEWVVTTDAEAVPRYEAIGQPNVILSQWACNPHVHRRCGCALAHDVTFVGQPHGSRRETVQWLRWHGIEVETWGQGWPNGRLSQEQMVEVFGTSRVNLNLSASSTHRVFGSDRSPQIKARVFEVPGCGGLLLTEWAPRLNEYYQLDSEIVVFRDRREVLEKVRWLLGAREECARIADAGWRRTMAEHTYERRLHSIFESVGVTPSADAKPAEYSVGDVL